MSAPAPDERAVLRRRLRRAAPLLVLAVAAVLVAVVITPSPDRDLPLHPASTGPSGTRALVDVLARLGRPATVVAPDELDGAGDVVLVLRDQFTRDERAALLERVEAGARLVVTDPGSPLVPAPAGGLSPLEPPLARDCDVAALAQVGAVDATSGTAYEVPDGALGCYPVDDGTAWLVVQQRGQGEVISTGSPGFLTNAALLRADDAVLAVHLLAPGDTGTPTIVRPVVREGREGRRTLSDLVPDQVRVAVWQVLIGFLVLVAWRSRRLGRPLEDHAPVRLDSSDLTAAVGALLSRNDSRGAALERVAAHARRRLARRLDLPPDVDLDLLAEQVATRTPYDAATVAHALAPPPPADDAQLLAATRTITDLEQAVLDRLATTPEEADVR